MTCLEAEVHVSTLYDGEQVPLDAANHIDDCAVCRERLRSYAEMGAEIRLLASQHAAVSAVPDELVMLRRRNRFGFLKQRILVPRFALVALVLALVAGIPASWSLMRAQSNRRWF